jgi:hypothetical protein
MPYIGTAPSSELANLDINGQNLFLMSMQILVLHADTDDQIDFRN